MIAAARAKGIDALLLGVADMNFDASSTPLFPTLRCTGCSRRSRRRGAIFRALKPGGRFAGEMGGEGNLKKLREALDEELVIRGYVPPAEASNWYPSPEEFAGVYEAAGVRTRSMRA